MYVEIIQKAKINKLINKSHLWKQVKIHQHISPNYFYFSCQLSCKHILQYENQL